MRTDEFDEIFDRTLDDQKLSRSEKRALQELVDDWKPDARLRATLRHRATEAVHRRIHDPRDQALVQWLGEVLKLLQKPERPEAHGEARFSPGGGCVKRVAGLFDSTRQKVDVCVFTITDNRITDAILRAHGRGIALRIITDDEKSFDAGSDIQRLREAGIPVREDRSPHHMHNKFALFDGALLLTGSFNWTRSGNEVNQENIVVVNHPTLLGSFREQFQSLWEQYA